MLSRNLKNKFRLEYDKIRQEKDPEITTDIEAVVVLSGESQDPAIMTKWHDTEDRTSFGIEIYKKVIKLGGLCKLLLNGTDIQNLMMQKIAKDADVENMVLVKNPPFPIASTKTQLQALAKLNYKNIAIVTHSYHAPRVALTAAKITPKISISMFLLGRKDIKKGEIEREINKIKMYFYE